MKKLLLILVIIIVISGALYTYLLVTRMKSSSEQGPAEIPTEKEVPVDLPTPTETEKKQPGSQEAPAAAPDPATLEKVKNLPKTSQPLSTPGVYMVEEYPVRQSPADVPEYSIAYFQGSNGNDVLSIILNRYPLGETRQRAEQALLNRLGISQEEACKLNVEVGVTTSTSPILSDQNLGLSFCPNAVDLSGYQTINDGYGAEE